VYQHKLNDKFDYILGLDNIYAKSKVELAKNFVSKNNAYNYYLVGDTLHDFEVANEIDAKCILLMNGHQSISKIKKSNAIIAENLEELISIIN
ncbi:MAG: HAD hydrolase-like protein, partial [Christensenellaceae bacterium]|nr:HAD hydrolase-like protein [Christensenellaceae bacterium]